MNHDQISLQRSEPIFAVKDVAATVRYYRDVLGFSDEWLWGDPPDFGGIRWGKIGVMFALHQDPATRIARQNHAFFVEGLNALHELHVRNGAIIISPLEAKPWGLREYTVRDFNGHFLRFGERALNRAANSGREPASSVEIVERLPNLDEYLALFQAVGWANLTRPETAEQAIAGARFGVVAMDAGRVIGTGLILGDGVSFAYLKDIMVHPDWQGRGVGTRVVQTLLDHIRQTRQSRMLVTLFTGAGLASFYERFGFCGPDAGLYGMSLHL
jgi:GNAT superfamily N-acetyltransferase/uncharacterized glyoxalase superfamily protein PhnB